MIVDGAKKQKKEKWSYYIKKWKKDMKRNAAQAQIESVVYVERFK